MAAKIPFVRDMSFEYGVPQQVSPLIRRVVAENPGPFTFRGTGVYIVGHGEVAVIDPGPDMPAHIDLLLKALDGETVTHIFVTHGHMDHSPAARPLAAATGAPVIGCAPLTLETVGPRADASFDVDYAPDRVLADGEGIAVDGLRLVAVATPGHTSNHLCFALEGGASDGALFTGDHVMGWSTTVVFPPDGDMGDYMASLDKLRQRKDRIYYPAHGPAVTKPAQLVRGMIGHRMQRERQILKRLGDGDRTIGAIVASSYPGLDPRLVPAAGGSVMAHLMDLTRRGLVEAAEDQWKLTTPKD